MEDASLEKDETNSEKLIWWRSEIVSSSKRRDGAVICYISHKNRVKPQSDLITSVVMKLANHS